MKKRIKRNNVLMAFVLLACTCLVGCGEFTVGTLGQHFNVSIDASYNEEVKALDNVKKYLTFVEDQTKLNEYTRTYETNIQRVRNMKISGDDLTEAEKKEAKELLNCIYLDEMKAFAGITLEYFLATEEVLKNYKTYLDKFEIDELPGGSGYFLYVNRADAKDYWDALAPLETNENGWKKTSKKSTYALNTTRAGKDVVQVLIEDSCTYKYGDDILGSERNTGTGNLQFLGVNGNFVYGSDTTGLRFGDDNHPDTAIALFGPSDVTVKMLVGNEMVDVPVSMPDATDWLDSSAAQSSIKINQIGVVRAYNDRLLPSFSNKGHWRFPSLDRKEHVEKMLGHLAKLRTAWSGYGYGDKDCDGSDDSAWDPATWSAENNKLTLVTNPYHNNQYGVYHDYTVEVSVDKDESKYLCNVRNGSTTLFTMSIKLDDNSKEYGIKSLDDGTSAEEKSSLMLLEESQFTSIGDVLKNSSKGNIYVLDNTDDSFNLQALRNLMPSTSGSNAAVAGSTLKGYLLKTSYVRNMLKSYSGDSIDVKAETTKIVLDIGKINFGYVNKVGLDPEVINDIAATGESGSRGLSYVPFKVDTSGTSPTYGFMLTTYPVMRISSIKREDSKYKLYVEKSGMYVNLIEAGLYKKAAITSISDGAMTDDDDIYLYDDNSIDWVISSSVNSSSSGGDTSRILAKDLPSNAYIVGSGGKGVSSDNTTVGYTKFLLLDYLEGLYMPGQYHDESVLALGRKISLDKVAIKGDIVSGVSFGKLTSLMGGTSSTVDIGIGNLLSAEGGYNNVTVGTGVFKGRISRNTFTASMMQGAINASQHAEERKLTIPGYTAKSLVNLSSSDVVSMDDVESGIEVTTTYDYVNSLLRIEAFGLGTLCENNISSCVRTSGGVVAIAQDEGDDFIELKVDWPSDTAEYSGVITIAKTWFNSVGFTLTIGLKQEEVKETKPITYPVVLSDVSHEAGTVGFPLGNAGEASKYKRVYSDEIKVTELRTSGTDTNKGLLAGYETSINVSNLPKLFVMGHLYNTFDTGFYNSWITQTAEQDIEQDGNLRKWCIWLQSKGYKNYPIDLDNMEEALEDFVEALDRVYNFETADANSGIVLDPNIIGIIQGEMDSDTIDTEAEVIRAACLIVGILIGLYAFLILIAWLIDAGTSGDGEGMLSKITFRKMRAATGVSRKDAISMSTEGYKLVTVSMLIPRVAALLVLAVILIAVDPITLVARLIEIVDGVYRMIRKTVFNVGD